MPSQAALSKVPFGLLTGCRRCVFTTPEIATHSRPSSTPAPAMPHADPMGAEARPGNGGLSSSAVPPSGHPLAATNARECIGAGMAVPLTRRASLDDLPAVLTLERRDLQPRAGAARSGERYLAREFASLLQ